MHEGIPNKERITAEIVVSALRKNSEDLSVLNQFLDERQAEVKSTKDALNLNVQLAEIYRDAGLVDAAYEAFLDARDHARQEGDDELADKLDDEAIRLMIE